MLWPLLLGLLGCRGLSGTWQGELLCLGRADTVDGMATVRLLPDGGGEFDGELRAEGDFVDNAGRRPMVLAWVLELEKTAPAGRQRLDGGIDRCELYVDGRLTDETCPDDPLTWTWDGGDLLELESDRCSLSLLR